MQYAEAQELRVQEDQRRDLGGAATRQRSARSPAKGMERSIPALQAKRQLLTTWGNSVMICTRVLSVGNDLPGNFRGKRSSTRNTKHLEERASTKGSLCDSVRAVQSSWLVSTTSCWPKRIHGAVGLITFSDCNGQMKLQPR